MRRFLSIILLVSIGLLPNIRCGSDPFYASPGGSGTETVGMIGMLVDTSGAFVENASVVVQYFGALLDTTADSVYTTTTDPEGWFVFGEYGASMPVGWYTLEAYTSDTSLIATDTIEYDTTFDPSLYDSTKENDTLYIKYLNLGAVTMQAPGTIAGRVLLEYSDNHGFVFIAILGTPYLSVSDDSGYFFIKAPEGEYTLSYRSTNEDYEPASMEGISVVSGQTVIVDSVVLKQKPTALPPSPQGLTASYDTLEGLVYLRWNRVNVPDLDKYAVYLDTTSSNPVPVGETAETLFVHQAFTDPEDPQSYGLRFQVTAVDTLSNESEYSLPFDITACSPTLVKTYFTWTLLPDSSDTLTEIDTVRLAAAFTNATRLVSTISWRIEGVPAPVQSNTPSSMSGVDTLEYVFSDTGDFTVTVQAVDAAGDTCVSRMTVKIHEYTQIRPTNEWDTLSSAINVARRFHSAAILDNSIYIVGGETEPPLITGTVSLSYLEVLSFTDTAWTNAADMPTERTYCSAVASGGKIYVTGGFDYSSFTFYNDMEVYDPFAGWETAVGMPASLFAHAACAIGNTIYIIGGMDDQFELSANIYAYDISNSTWSTPATLNTPRTAHQAVVLDGKIYIIGGQDEMGNPFASVEVFDPGSGLVSQAPPLNTPRSNFGAAAALGKIYVIGGYNSISDEPLSSVEMYHPDSTGWTGQGLETIGTPRHGFATCVWDNIIYIIGGSEKGYYPEKEFGRVNTVLRYYP